MYKLLKIKLLIGLIFAVNTIGAQIKPVDIGNWRVHLSYNNAIKITETPDKVFCATTYGLFQFVKSGGNIERLSKADGFYGYEISDLVYDFNTDNLIIAYNDCTIETIKGNKITVNNDIKRETIIGSKQINSINIVGNIAYLSCSFGLIEFNILKNEIRNSYLNIGDNGSRIAINSSTILNDSIYLTTNTGIIKASTSPSVNLSDYNNWYKSNNLRKKSKYIAAFNNKLFAEIDSQLFIYQNMIWSKYEKDTNLIVSNINVYHNNLLIGVYGKHIITEDINGVKTYLGVNQLNQCLLDKNNTYWYASPYNGLVNKQPWGEITYVPNGPKTADNYAFTNAYNKLYVSAGGFPQDNFNKYYSFDNISWDNPPQNAIADTLKNYRDFAYNKNNGTLYIGTHGRGILQLNNGIPTRVYDNTNSALKRWAGDQTVTLGLEIDKNNNLWLCNKDVDSSLVQLTNRGVWYKYKLPVSSNTKLAIDNKNNKWIASPNSSVPICVYNDKGTVTKTDDNVYSLGTNKGNGNLPSSNITAMAFTKEGELLIGTDLGYCRIPNPNNIFTGGNFDAQRIIIGVEEGTNLGGYLLGSEFINCITLDGADRRWVGTNNGAWLLANDGQTILKHFTTENSPLMTNEIKSIGIMESTGEVFFGTPKGIISYRSDALSTSKNLEKIIIFPNPVRPDFDGNVAITGLMENTLVKITDINGQLVYQTYSNGGMATWNCRTFNGDRPSTGVYLAFCINADGSETGLGKILFIK